MAPLVAAVSVIQHKRDGLGRFVVGNSRHDLPILSRYTEDSSGCWDWSGYRGVDGYGRCKAVGTSRTILAHRVFYERFVGAVPEGMDLDHLCRNRGCVNPQHLEPVSRALNVQRGKSAKLTPDQVAEIRWQVDALCGKYGVRPRTLSAIGERQIWVGIEPKEPSG